MPKMSRRLVWGEPRLCGLEMGWRRDRGREVQVSRHFDGGMGMFLCRDDEITIRRLSLPVCVSIIPTSPHGTGLALSLPEIQPPGLCWQFLANLPLARAWICGNTSDTVLLLPPLKTTVGSTSRT